jgi:hypothetical protein
MVHIAPVHVMGDINSLDFSALPQAHFMAWLLLLLSLLMLVVHPACLAPRKNAIGKAEPITTLWRKQDVKANPETHHRKRSPLGRPALH